MGQSDIIKACFGASYLVALGAAVVLFAQSDPLAVDNLIVPGVRVGPVTSTSTETSLIQLLGRNAAKENVHVGEGNFEPGLVIYKNDPTRRLEVVWNRDVPAHPSYVFICPSSLGTHPPCRWRTADGIGMGTTLKELERLNGKPFKMVVWGSDVGGGVSFDSGALSVFDGSLEREPWNRDRLFLRLEPRTDEKGNGIPKLSEEEKNEVYDGEKIVASSNPVLQKMNPYVEEVTMRFPSGDKK